MVALRLSRQQIATIVGNDQEAIKQFERLFTLNQDYLVSGIADSSEIDSGSAIAMANSAAAIASEFEERIAALEGAPSHTPHISRFDYGSFYSTADQIAAAANTAYAVTFSDTRTARGITIGSPTSRLYITKGNVYRIGYTLQAINSGGFNHLIYSWMRVNGTTDVAASTAVTTVGSGSSANFISAETLLHLTGNDYIELMWEVSGTAVSLNHDVATGVHPATPSANIVITNNISAEGALT